MNIDFNEIDTGLIGSIENILNEGIGSDERVRRVKRRPTKLNIALAIEDLEDEIEDQKDFIEHVGRLRGDETRRRELISRHREIVDELEKQLKFVNNIDPE